MINRKVLFFISKSVPSEEELKLAKNYKNCKVCFRNVNFIDPKGCIEKADLYIGKVPANYPKGKKEVKQENEKQEENKTEEKKTPIWSPNV